MSKKGYVFCSRTNSECYWILDSRKNGYVYYYPRLNENKIDNFKNFYYYRSLVLEDDNTINTLKYNLKRFNYLKHINIE